MSQENVEMAARWYEPWATGKSELLTDMSRIMEFCHQNVEWSHREEGWTRRGREGLRRRSKHGSRASMSTGTRFSR